MKGIQAIPACVPFMYFLGHGIPGKQKKLSIGFDMCYNKINGSINVRFERNPRNTLPARRRTEETECTGFLN